MGISPDKIYTTGRDNVARNGIFALNGDIMIRKGVFCTIGELSYSGLFSYYIMSKDKGL